MIPDLSKTIQGNPCHKGHSGLRYRGNGHCVDCRRAGDKTPQMRARRGACYAKAKADRAAMRAALPATHDLIQSHRRNNRRVFTIAERTMTLFQWCAELRQDVAQVSRRLRSGWSVFDALNQPTARRIEIP